MVRRANPVRESYAIHLVEEQRTVDVPFCAAELRADVTRSPTNATPATAGAAGGRHAPPTGATGSTGGGARGE